ncbi:MAG: substrate-binding domain-containing protein [Spirochaetia bacterium]|nr:substrate-binding domain-containing protein [Spirochaetia bacterium]
MKNIVKIIAIIFGILFITALAFSALTIFNLSKASREQTASEEIAAYHFGVFLPQNTYLFFQDVIAGARAAAEEFDCALSFHPIGNDTKDFFMAKYAGFDGIIVYPSIAEQVAQFELDEINRAGIPIVLIEHGLSDKSPWPFVGTNNFDLGKKIGELSGRNNDQPIQMAVVYSEKSPGILSEKELVEMGIRSALNDRNIKLLTVMVTNLNPLDAENLTYQILRNEPEINTIVFTDTNDTLAAIQVLVDLNLVGSVRIIGFGTDEPILDNVGKGILAGTIAVFPVEIGYNAVKVLKSLCDEGYSESYVDTGVGIITKENLDTVQKGLGGGVK